MNENEVRRLVLALIAIGLKYNHDTDSYIIDGGYISRADIDAILNALNIDVD